MTITAAVDGSSLGNPGPAGWAWVVSPGVWDAGGWPLGTNNMGELTAVLELLRATEAAGLAHEPLHILADSQYAINCISKWMPGWKRRGWKKADGQPVANREILEELDRALVGRSYRFEWVKGHAGHSLNEAADSRARAVSEAYQARRSIPRGPGFGAGISVDRAAEPEVKREPATASGSSSGSGSAAEELRLPIARLAEASASPITISHPGVPDLVLMNAELAGRALRALDEPPSLF